MKRQFIALVFVAIFAVGVGQLLAKTYPKAYAYYAPRPAYGALKNGQWLRGKGVFVVSIDSKKGVVTAVAVKKSTGHIILDQAAITALYRWRFRTPSKPSVEVPIVFHHQT